MGAKIRMDQTFSKLQNLGQNRWWANGIRVEDFPGFNALQLSEEDKSLLYRLRETPEKSQEEFYLCRCSTTFPVEQKTMKKNVWQMLDSYRCMQEDLEKDTMVIHWSWFWKEVVLCQRRHSTTNLGQNCGKDVVGIRWERMSNFPCYDSIVQRSTQKQRTWYTVMTLCSQPGNDWDYFSHNCFCKPAQSLRSSRRNMWRVWNPSRKNGATCCDRTINQSFSVRSRQKFLWIVMTWLTRIFYCSNMENELKNYHNKTNWVNSVWMQDSWMLLRMDSISWRKTLEILHNLIQWPLVDTLFQENTKHHNRKAGSKETPELGHWKLQPVICTVNMELRSELCLWTETTLTSGLEFLMGQISLWWIWTTMEEKFPKISSNNMR